MAFLQAKPPPQFWEEDKFTTGSKMKSITRYAARALLAAGLLGASLSAMATTITFDDLKPEPYGSMIKDGYAGLNWVNFFVVNHAWYGGGYEPGTISQPNVAYNAFAAPASFSSAAGFNLESLYVTKAWVNGITHISGFSGANEVYSTDVYSTTTTPTFVTLNWSNLTKVTISDGNNTAHSAIDNITITAVPEPETYAMLLAGLGLVGFAASRNRRAV
jgi:hypothetical protein